VLQAGEGGKGVHIAVSFPRAASGQSRAG
jgi:two-component system sensor histidine kinase TctE